MSREFIVQTARKYLGTKFHHQGRKAGVGIDCVGLILACADALKIKYQDRPYSRQPDPSVLLQCLRGSLKEVSIDQILPGNVGVFWVHHQSKVPQHLGIFTPKGIIHAEGTFHIGKVVEHEFTESLRNRLTHVFEFPGVK